MCVYAYIYIYMCTQEIPKWLLHFNAPSACRSERPLPALSLDRHDGGSTFSFCSVGNCGRALLDQNGHMAAPEHPILEETGSAHATTETRSVA